MLGQRSSILNRPVKQPSLANVENREKEYQKEQEYWRIKAVKRAETEERLRESLYGPQRPPPQTSSESSNDALLSAKEQLRRLTQTASYMPECTSNAYRPSVAMPWAGASGQLGEGDQASMRRSWETSVTCDNKVLAAYRSQQRRLEEEVAKVEERQAFTTGDSWFNLGASNEAWVAPQYRVRHRSKLQVGPDYQPEAPYKWEEEMQQEQKTRHQVAPPNRPATAPPIWAWEDKQACTTQRNMHQASAPAAHPHQARPQQTTTSKNYPWTWET